ncbi:MAG: methyltransferase domain-containing protein [Deltaproteobacteria bacterium]|nr:methyltransferase domain-containing protein [Deltaproteobacteria bacterium]
MAKEWTIADILGISGSYWAGCALQAGIALDLFTAVEKGKGNAQDKRLSVRDLALSLACDERALGMLATALIALGFLEGNTDDVTLPEHSWAYLSRTSERYVGFIIKHHAHIMPGWVRLAEAVQSGRRQREISSSDTDDAEERENFLMGMFNIAVNQAEMVASALDLSGRKRLLDIGGGPGTYAVFFCKANPGMRATVFDRPTSKSFAGNVARRFGLHEFIDFAGGDFIADALPAGYDVAWLSHVLHGETPADAAKLVAKAAKTLNPGGLLAIQEFVLDDKRNGPVHPALFSLNMLVGTSGGQAYTGAEISDMLQKAGAERIKRLEIDLPMGCGILAGQMPG